MSDFIIVMDGGKEYEATFEEVGRFRKKRSTTGKQFPIFKMDSGTELAMDKVVAVEVSEYDPYKKEEPEKSEPIQKENKQIRATEDQLDKNQTEEEMLADFMKLADCKHKDVSLHTQVTKTGKKYFPVCDFCGHRGRYIAADKLTDKEKVKAIEWVERKTTQAVS